jgi:hypothetical protein
MNLTTIYGGMIQNCSAGNSPKKSGILQFKAVFSFVWSGENSQWLRECPEPQPYSHILIFGHEFGQKRGNLLY